jgi:hypothetical protein
MQGVGSAPSTAACVEVLLHLRLARVQVDRPCDGPHPLSRHLPPTCASLNNRPPCHVRHSCGLVCPGLLAAAGRPQEVQGAAVQAVIKTGGAAAGWFFHGHAPDAVTRLCVSPQVTHPLGRGVQVAMIGSGAWASAAMHMITQNTMVRAPGEGGWGRRWGVLCLRSARHARLDPRSQPHDVSPHPLPSPGGRPRGRVRGRGAHVDVRGGLPGGAPGPSGSRSSLPIEKTCLSRSAGSSFSSPGLAELNRYAVWVPEQTSRPRLAPCPPPRGRPRPWPSPPSLPAVEGVAEPTMS